MITTPEFDSELHRTAIAQLDAVAARLDSTRTSTSACAIRAARSSSASRS